MFIKRIKVKRILSRSGIGGCRYALNPYLGCSNGCYYCYAPHILRSLNFNREWGSFVYPKENGPLLLRKELKRLKRGKICIGTVCDPYLKWEEDFHITRNCLEELRFVRNPLSLQTKNGLILRDIDLLIQLNAQILITITTTDDRLREIFEPGASPVGERMRTIRELRGAGLSVTVFAGPLLPGLSDQYSALTELVAMVQESGAERIIFDLLNPYPVVRRRMGKLYRRYFPDLGSELDLAIKNRKGYRRKVKDRIEKVKKDLIIETIF